MLGSSDSSRWIVFYKWKGNFFQRVVLASNAAEAEDIVVDLLIKENKATDCIIVAVAPYLETNYFEK